MRYTVLAARLRYRIQKCRFIAAVELDRGRALTDALPMQVGDGQRALIDGERESTFCANQVQQPAF